MGLFVTGAVPAVRDNLRAHGVDQPAVHYHRDVEAALASLDSASPRSLT